MRLRWSAFLVALVLAASPVMGVVCAMNCDHMPAATAHCHDTSRDEGVTVGSVPQGCNHDCTSTDRALLSRVSVWSVMDLFTGASPIILQSIERALHPLRAVSLSSPPGSVGHGTPHLLTVLRI